MEVCGCTEGSPDAVLDAYFTSDHQLSLTTNDFLTAFGSVSASLQSIDNLSHLCSFWNDNLGEKINPRLVLKQVLKPYLETRARIHKDSKNPLRKLLI